MSKYTKIGTSEVISNRAKTVRVSINKYKKTSTNRVFFTPEFRGNRLTRTMFLRKYDARNLAKAFIKYKEKQS